MPSIQSNFEKLITTLFQRLQEAENMESDLPTRLDTCIRICEESLQILRQWVIEHSFPDNDTEIYFFKKIKPEVVGHYLFYRKQFSFHLSSCSLSTEMRMSLYEMKLNETQQFFTAHQFDYVYHIMGDTCHDELYFLRSNYDWKLCQSDHYPAEPGFATNGDGILANILANKLWGAYLLQQVEQADGMRNMTGKAGQEIRLNWTGPSTALIESIYAWHSLGWCGNDSIKKVMEGISGLFSKDLGDYYRKIQHIDHRKINPTKGLDQMKTALLNRFRQLDDQRD
ncbi:MAG: RteC domain-containing protein [Niastella sp.]|nr:RteC domain-containing protein [Niastella sp.]